MQLQQAGGVFTNAALAAVNSLLSSQGIMTQGNVLWVRPGTGTDSMQGGQGSSPSQAFKTLGFALTQATANQNDVVVLCAEGNTAGLTTDYVSTAIDWNKNGVHLIGLNAGPSYSPRSRVAFADSYATAAPLFTLSASGCLIAGIEFFMGVASTAPLGAMLVTGSRNVIKGCHIAGIGNNANDIAGAYSLRLYGAIECRFDDCTIGLDTIARGTAANSEILIDAVSGAVAGATRCEFNCCKIVSLIEHATNHPQVKLLTALAIDRSLTFKECDFLNMSIDYAYAQAGIFKLVAALTKGFINVNRCFANRSDNSTAPTWDVDNRNQICVSNTPLPVGETAGVGLMM